MSTTNIRISTAQNALDGDWRGSSAVNSKNFTIGMMNVEVDMDDPMVRTLRTPEMLNRFLHYIDLAFRAGQDQGFKDGVEIVRSELRIMTKRCDLILDEKTSEQREFDEYQRYKLRIPPINPLLDEASAHELFEGRHRVRSTPKA